MARVKVRGFTVVRDALRAPEVEVEVADPLTVRAVFDALLREYGQPLRQAICDSTTGKLASFPITLNDELISSTLDMDRPVRNGDEIAIIFPIGGGCQWLRRTHTADM